MSEFRVDYTVSDKPGSYLHRSAHFSCIQNARFFIGLQERLGVRRASIWFVRKLLDYRGAEVPDVALVEDWFMIEGHWQKRSYVN